MGVWCGSYDWGPILVGHSYWLVDSTHAIWATDTSMQFKPIPRHGLWLISRDHWFEMFEHWGQSSSAHQSIAFWQTQVSLRPTEREWLPVNQWKLRCTTWRSTTKKTTWQNQGSDRKWLKWDSDPWLNISLVEFPASQVGSAWSCLDECLGDARRIHILMMVKHVGYIYTYAYIYIYIYVYIHVYIYIRIYTYIHIFVCVCECQCVGVKLWSVFLYIYICVCVFIYLLMCIYKYCNMAIENHLVKWTDWKKSFINGGISIARSWFPEGNITMDLEEFSRLQQRK